MFNTFFFYTCEVFLSELDQGENHTVCHLVGQLRVERIQLDHTHTHGNTKIKPRQRKGKRLLPDILLDFHLLLNAGDTGCQFILRQWNWVQAKPLLSTFFHHDCVKKPCSLPALLHIAQASRSCCNSSCFVRKLHANSLAVCDHFGLNDSAGAKVHPIRATNCWPHCHSEQMSSKTEEEVKQTTNLCPQSINT